MREHLEKLRQKKNLSEKEIALVMSVIVSGNAAHADILDFLRLMREKGPQVDEITGAARALREVAVTVKTRHTKVLDTCGTGGDKKGTFNISTITALVVAAGGVVVAKHGNRSVSSKCGSADILEALGVKLLSDPVRLGQCLDEVGLAFLFAPMMHPAMKNVSAARKELGTETIFNILGPLLNPARATHQIMGVYNRDLVEPMAEVLRNLGLQRAFVVNGGDGLDEITTTTKSFVAEWTGEDIITYDVVPEEFSFSPATVKDLQGGDLATNVSIVQDILDGKKGPKRDIVVLNAGYAFYLAGQVKDVNEGIAFAGDVLDDGQAWVKLSALIDFTNS